MFTYEIAQNITNFMISFKSDDNSAKLSNFNIKLLEKIRRQKMKIAGPVFKNIVHIALTYQQWKLIYDLLVYSSSLS